MTKYRFKRGKRRKSRSKKTINHSPLLRKSVEMDQAIRNRISYINNHYVGKTLEEIATMEPDTERDAELYIPLSQKKGAVGRWFEWFVTGEKPDNRPSPDIGGFELKCIAAKKVENDTFKPYENQRLSILNYNNIQTTSFEESCTFLKGKMIVFIVSKTESGIGADKVLLGCGTISLEDIPSNEAEQDYKYFQQMCKEGRADELSSRIDQPNKWLKAYSSGSGSNEKTYFSADGEECLAKGKAIYLFKEEWMRLFKPWEDVISDEPESK